MPYIKAGRLRAYGLSTIKPSVVAPGIEPLATAANLPGFDAAAWIGIMVPAGTPKPIVDRLSAGVDKAMQFPDTGAKLNASDSTSTTGVRTTSRAISRSSVTASATSSRRTTSR